MATAEELAWAGGLFEGEGCFSSIGRVGVHGRRKARASLAMADAKTVLRFRDVMGFGNIHINRRANGRHLTVWVVSNEKDFRRTVELLGPWLSKRRLDRAAELIVLLELPVGKAWGNTPPEDRHNGKKLTMELAREIRAATGTCSMLAERFGVSRSTISHVKTGYSWRE
jgi:hypothetical protein